MKRIIIIFAAVIAAVSCKKADTLSVSPASITSVASSGTSVTLTVDTNHDWTASTTQSWVHISPATGASGQTSVTVKVDANETYDARSASINFISASLTKSISVDQNQKNAIILSSTEEEIGSQGGSIKVQIKANVDYQVEIASSDSWIKRTTTKGLKDYSEVFEIEANTTFSPREGKIVIKSMYEAGVITVKQAQNNGLIITEKEFNIPAEGGNIGVKVSSNVGCTAKVIEGEKWISEVTTKSLIDYDFRFSVAANDTYEDRVGRIEFTADDGSLKDTVTINQSLNYGLFLTESGASVNREGGEVEVVLKSNVEYEYSVIEGAEWVSEIQTKSLNTYTHMFQVEENKELTERVAKIEFRAKDTDITDVFTITQNGSTNVLKFSHSQSNGFVPTVSGTNVEGKIEWGDGTSSSYSKGATHKYRNSAGKTFQEVLTLTGAEGFCFESLEKVKTLDMSGF